MGQYYRAILGDSFGFNCKVFDRSVEGMYTLAKLMEHSWWHNEFVNSFAEKLYNKQKRVCWVGDYADEPNDFKFRNNSAFYTPCYTEVWGNQVEMQSTHLSDFTLDDKFLINIDSSEYIDLNRYKEQSQDKDGWIIHPLSLLTAVGNDRGGGDFHEGNIGYEYVGIWAWNLISIRDKAPRNFRQLDVAFKEVY